MIHRHRHRHPNNKNKDLTDITRVRTDFWIQNPRLSQKQLMIYFSRLNVIKKVMNKDLTIRMNEVFLIQNDALQTYGRD